MKKIALITIALLTATNAFAMSEQAKGSIDAANDVHYFSVVNKYCKFMSKSDFADNFGYITEFAIEYRVQYPDYDLKYTALADTLDANLAKATKKKIKEVCKDQKQGFKGFAQKYGGWDD